MEEKEIGSKRDGRDNDKGRFKRARRAAFCAVRVCSSSGEGGIKETLVG